MYFLNLKSLMSDSNYIHSHTDICEIIIFFGLGIKSSSGQGLVLSLHSGITLASVHVTIWDAEYCTRLS